MMDVEESSFPLGRGAKWSIGRWWKRSTRRTRPLIHVTTHEAATRAKALDRRSDRRNVSRCDPQWSPRSPHPVD